MKVLFKRFSSLIFRRSHFFVLTILLVFSLILALSLASFAEQRLVGSSSTPRVDKGVVGSSRTPKVDPGIVRSDTITVKGMGNNLKAANESYTNTKIPNLSPEYYKAILSLLNDKGTSVKQETLQKMAKEGYMTASQVKDEAGLYDKLGRLVGGKGSNVTTTALAPQEDGNIARISTDKTTGSYNTQKTDYTATSSPTYGLSSGWNAKTGRLEYKNADGTFSGVGYTGWTTAGGDGYYYENGVAQVDKSRNQFVGDKANGREGNDVLENTVKKEGLDYKQTITTTDTFEKNKKASVNTGIEAIKGELKTGGTGEPYKEDISEPGNRQTRESGYLRPLNTSTTGAPAQKSDLTALGAALAATEAEKAAATTPAAATAPAAASTATPATTSTTAAPSTGPLAVASTATLATTSTTGAASTAPATAAPAAPANTPASN